MITDNSLDTDLLSKDKASTKQPEDYQVILLNDDFTPMDFVVLILCKIFHKNIAEATELMLEVHINGKSVVGTYSFDIAATKTEQVHTLAKSKGYPLKCIMTKI